MDCLSVSRSVDVRAGGRRIVPTTMDHGIPSARDRILEAARELFLTKGYNGSNLRDIAGRARVSMGGIYHHFSSKEQIYESVLGSMRFGNELPRMVALYGSPDFPDNLPDIGRAIFDLARRCQDDFKLIYIDILEFQGRHVKPLVAPLRATLGSATAALLAERHARGEVAQVHSTVVARSIVGLFLYFYLEDVMLEMSASDEAGIDDDEIAEQMADLLLHGLLRSGGT